MHIGVFDSGVGGEAVAHRLQELLPQARIRVANDRAHVPYGSRAEPEVAALTERAIQPLLEAGCQVIVLACNTATAAAIGHLRRTYPDTAFVGLEPMVKPAARVSTTGHVVVCATPTTLASDRYRQLISTWASTITISEPDCVSWAQAVEAGDADTVDFEQVRSLVVRGGADVVVLACTHYHWLAPRMRAELGPEVTVMEPTEAIAEQLRRITGVATSEEHRT